MDIFDLFKKIETGSPKSGTPITHIVAGLGNPGDKYKTTRHNAGFMTVDYAAQKLGTTITTSKFEALYTEAVIGGKRVLLLKPQTFMNNSGQAVLKAKNFYKVPSENVIVIHDDTSFESGTFKIRKKGSAGGHNGIKSIIECLGTEEFVRIKMGVGKKPHPEMVLADWVLSHFSAEEMKSLEERFEDVKNAIEAIVTEGADKAMNRFNG